MKQSISRHGRFARRDRFALVIFKQYFVGKVIQTICIMTVSFICFTIARVPYPALCAAFIAVTNLIPYIGPWIGGIPVVLLCLAKDFKLAIYALICVLISQAVDNWLVGPRVIGDRIGVSPLLVLIGLGVGGALFGIPGMLLGDVTAALIKVFFYDNYIANKLAKKKAAKEAAIEAAEDPPPEDGGEQGPEEETEPKE